MSFGETVLAFGSAFVIFGVLLIAALLYQRHLGIVPGGAVKSVSRPAPKAVMSNDVLGLWVTLLFLQYLHARNSRTELPNRTAEPSNGYQRLTERQRAVAEKALRAGLSMSDLCVAFGGTKSLRLDELRPIKAEVDAEGLAREIGNPSIQVPAMEPVPS